MNLKGRLEHIAQMLDAGRRYGKTTAIAKICKEFDGVLLTHNFQFAKDLEREFKITTKSIDVNLHGLSGPFFIDHHAISALLFRASNKISELETKYRQLELSYENTLIDNENLMEQLRRFKSKIKDLEVERDLAYKTVEKLSKELKDENLN